MNSRVPIFGPTMPNKFTMTIAGGAADAKQRLSVVNPAYGTMFASIPDAGKQHLAAAVEAARFAFDQWKHTSIDTRRDVLTSFADQIDAHRVELGELLTREQGRPYKLALHEIDRSTDWFRQIADNDIEPVINEDNVIRYSETHHVPLGVVGAIVPWNYPFLLAVWKIAPALLMGNSVILKPSPFTPLTMLRLGELMRGLIPDGIFNVITGGDMLGPWMTSNPGIDKIAFTGSTETGKKVMASAAGNLKRLTLELGGNDPAIVLPDVDIDSIIPKLFGAAFGNSGQICIATKRLYVHDDIYDDVFARLCAFADDQVLGDGMDSDTNFGPIQNHLQYSRVRELFEQCQKDDLTMYVSNPSAVPEEGYFHPLTLVDNPPENSDVVQREAFGPILPILKFTDLDEVIARANNSDFGLGASVWTKDLTRARQIAVRMEAGTIWLNETRYISPLAPMAGHKFSGFGVEHGKEGLWEYSVPKTITFQKSHVI